MRRWLRSGAPEWLVFILLSLAGGMLVLVEYRLGLLDWVDPIGENDNADFDIYLTLGVTQAVLVGIAAAWKWRAITRLRLCGALLLGAAISFLELKAGWLDWTLRGPEESGGGKYLPIPILVVAVNTLIVVVVGGIVWAGLSPED